jgi:putative tricarboxylic transport membrane protein
MRVPWAILTPIIVVALVIGAYAMRNFMFDIWCVFIFGILGYAMKKLNYPLAPLAVALVLGSMAEADLRRSLIMGDGSIAIFFERPLTAGILGFAFLLFALPIARMLIVKIRGSMGAGKQPA